MDVREAIYEQVLVLRCQSGDDVAFAELVDRYTKRLGYYLRKMLRDPDEADDALQDVWLAVHRGASRLKDTRAFRAWVYRLARDRAFRHLRRMRPILEPIGDELIDAEDDEPFTPEDAATVHRALDELSADHREVLLLRFVEDMNYEQIADIVGCSVGTVRSRLHYGKSALRAIIGKVSEP
jgi:RNA polymerase sigma-70 factor (ECF subfamily)